MLVYARFLSVYVILPTHVSPQVQWIIERKRPPPFYCSNGNNACHGRRLIVSYISAFDRDIFIPYSGVFRKNYETCMTHVIILYTKKKKRLLTQRLGVLFFSMMTVSGLGGTSAPSESAWGGSAIRRKRSCGRLWRSGVCLSFDSRNCSQAMINTRQQ